ncbi:MAG: QacE family quaternary ammonium compound efflux SMR transporter [Methanobrevibacter sp.]|jgi:quaternary ammonium compound-resistance protein SugE|nr:QacE family quaternary ammonium compound efflux SMR transporter [Candidatus Methanoflexus mossambicus]
MNPWIYLIIAGFLEIGWAISLKFSNGLTNILMVISTAVIMILSLFFLSLSLKSLPLGTAYAIWTAIGAVGLVIVGMIFLGESKSIIRIFCIMLIIGGIIGLKITGK